MGTEKNTVKRVICILSTLLLIFTFYHVLSFIIFILSFFLLVNVKQHLVFTNLFPNKKKGKFTLGNATVRKFMNNNNVVYKFACLYYSFSLRYMNAHLNVYNFHDARLLFCLVHFCATRVQDHVFPIYVHFVVFWIYCLFQETT